MEKRPLPERPKTKWNIALGHFTLKKMILKCGKSKLLKISRFRYIVYLMRRQSEKYCCQLSLSSNFIYDTVVQDKDALHRGSLL